MEVESEWAKFVLKTHKTNHGRVAIRITGGGPVGILQRDFCCVSNTQRARGHGVPPVRWIVSFMENPNLETIYDVPGGTPIFLGNLHIVTTHMLMAHFIAAVITGTGLDPQARGNAWAAALGALTDSLARGASCGRSWANKKWHVPCFGTNFHWFFRRLIQIRVHEAI